MVEFLDDYAALRAYSGAATAVQITGDKTAGLFRHEPADTTSLDDGGTIIVGTDGRRWKRLFVGAVSAAWFGLVPDAMGDNTCAINAAIRSAFQQGFGAVQLPIGRYKVTTIEWYEGVQLEGINCSFNAPVPGDSSELVGTDGYDVLVLVGVGTSYYDNFRMRRVAVTGGCNGINISEEAGKGVTNLHLREVRFSGQENANFRLETWMERCSFEGEFIGADYCFQAVNNGTISNYIDKTAWLFQCRFGARKNAFNVDLYRACNALTWYNPIFNGVGEHVFVWKASANACTIITPNTESVGTAGPALHVTTGAMAAGSDTLSVAAVGTYVLGQQLTVEGAGASGADLVANIIGLAGTSVTLSAPASSAVAGAAVTNAIYDEFVFGQSSGTENIPTGFTFISPEIGSSASSSRIRYALNDGPGYCTIFGGTWVRPVSDPNGRVSVIGGRGQVRRRPDVTSLYQYFTIGDPRVPPLETDPWPTVVPGAPGEGVVLSLRGDTAGTGTTGDFGSVRVIKTSSTRRTVVEISGNTESMSVGGAVANPSAKLEVSSTTSGLLPPRMTKAQRDAIAAPANGLVVYQTDAMPGLRCCESGVWVRYSAMPDP